MPRRGYKRQQVTDDKLYNSYKVSKFINYIMIDGKKSVAEKIVYSTFDHIRDAKLDPINVLETAVSNVAPSKEVRPRRVGGASYLVPMDTSTNRKLFLAFNWIINSARARSNKQYKTFADKLYAELMDAYKGEGEAINKKVQIEKLAEANKAFSHFSW